MNGPLFRLHLLPPPQPSTSIILLSGARSAVNPFPPGCVITPGVRYANPWLGSTTFWRTVWPTTSSHGSGTGTPALSRYGNSPPNVVVQKDIFYDQKVWHNGRNSFLAVFFNFEKFKAMHDHLWSGPVPSPMKWKFTPHHRFSDKVCFEVIVFLTKKPLFCCTVLFYSI